MKIHARSAGVLAVACTVVLSAAMGGVVHAQPSTVPAKALSIEPEAVPQVASQDARLAVAANAATAPVPRGGGPTSYTNVTAITITDCPNPCPAAGQAASLYPSPITVAGETGVVERVSVTINGFSHSFPVDTDFLLVSPSGRKSVLMSDFGAGSPGVSNINVTLDDYADRPVPSTVTSNTGVPFVTGTYRPANSGTTDVFSAPAPAAPYTYTLSAFNGDTPNGTWNLYIIDDANLDGGSISGGWTLTFDTRPAPPAAGDILITEFRTRGAGTTPPGSDGSADEFIEIYNNTDASITIIDAIPGADPTSPTGAGWRFSGAQGGAETTFLVLPQTLNTAGPLALPPRGYFLVSTQPTMPSPAGNTYSLSNYPTGTGITASGSANVSVNPGSATVGFLPDDVGLAVFSTAAALTAHRMDAVGYSSVTLADYKEGAGLAPAAGITTAGQHSWVRRESSGFPQDTGDNAADFVLVDTTGGTLNGIPATLGAPGPERGPTMTAFTTTSAPLHTAAGLDSDVIDPLQAADAAPNLVRDFTPVTNGAEGTMKFRRRYTNTSGLPFVAMRFRIVGITTLTGGSVPMGSADLRVLNSPTQNIVLTDTTNITSQALTLQTPPAQPLGGGLNSSLAEGIITTAAPLANGASTYVEFNFGVETDGDYLVTVLAEGLTVPPNAGASALDTFGVLPTPEADLSITKTDGVASVLAGGGTTYTITASNAGPSDAPGATVADTFPADCGGVTWTCVGTGGGTCMGSGSGNITDTVNLPAGGLVTYSATCTVAPAAASPLVNTATVAAPAGVTDTNPANNSATDSNAVLAPGALTVAPPSVNFGQVVVGSASGTMTVTLGNSGGVGLSVGPLTAPAAPFALSGGSCSGVPIAIAAGASCTLDYTFTPAAPGLASQNFTVDAGAAGAGAFTLNGEGVQGVIGVLSDTLDFGELNPGSSSLQMLEIINSGSGPLQVTGMTTASAPFSLALLSPPPVGTCGSMPFTLAAGESCTVIYDFSPTMQGSFSQVITITSDVGTATATLVGRGAVMAAVLVPAGSTMAWLLLVMMLAGVVLLRRRV